MTYVGTRAKIPLPAEHWWYCDENDDDSPSENIFFI